MSKYIAFLRAINVGGHTVKMDDLRRLFEALNLSAVETFIASGNVIFDTRAKDTSALERKIENHLRASLGYEVATFVRSTSEVISISDYQPFKAADLAAEQNRLYIGFLANSPTEEARKKLLLAATSVDDFHVAGREVYWLCRTTFRESLFSGARIEKTLGLLTTLRNANTVRRLAAKYSTP